MTTTPVRVQVPSLNLQQEIDSSIRYTSATCLTHSVATPSLHDPSNHTDKNIQSVYYSARDYPRHVKPHRPTYLKNS
ncbi:hypothetical protein OUZ56_010582 [Daphnia magna]|uniref:Uncharacterized protein n=1 Tax=Daphnia magna TaxID=35525 RepID=A0ABR0AIY8_9CRUS|nr:hypothetical protein OUZ56_010582 [Daphnia magna]